MATVVLTPPSSETAVRAALSRAVLRLPATIVEAPLASRAERLAELAEDADIDWICIADADAAPAADAFGAVRRAAGNANVIVGGGGLVGSGQRLGAMFAPSRSGPDPFELVPLIAPQADRGFTELVRGPVDVPQRGAYLVSAEFVRSLRGVALDPLTLHLDLAVHARAAKRSVVCEPSLAFRADEDSPELRRALGNLRRFTDATAWNPDDMHRDAPRLRSAFVMPEVRVMGNFRGFARRPYPPIDVIVVATDELGARRAAAEGAKLAVNGVCSVCAPSDGDTLRRALGRTGDRYVLLADAGALPTRSDVEMLAERLERNSRRAVALSAPRNPNGVALFHCGRIVNGAALGGASVWDVVAEAIGALPLRRLFAAAPGGEIVPESLPPLPGLRTLDIIFVAASRPVATEQTLQAVMGEPSEGTMAVVYPAGMATTERQFTVHPGLRLFPDESDVQLAVGLNRALGASTADGVAIVRDDAQLPHGALERLKDAFRRLPRLGVAVPRIGGADRPESLPDLGYRSSAQLQTLYERRAEAYAREATTLEFATSPVLVVSREALEVVGGFDERFGLSRFGVEDFTRRMRSANFLVACCEDAYAHLFPPEEAASLVAALDDSSYLQAACQARWASPRGFDPQTDRVPLRTDVASTDAAAERQVVRILIPLADRAEWELAQPLVAELAAAFRVSDPVEIAMGIDGKLTVHEVVGELRELMLASNVPMSETVTVNIEVVHELPRWRDAGMNNVRTAGSEREGLADLPVVDGANAVRALLHVPIA